MPDRDPITGRMPPAQTGTDTAAKVGNLNNMTPDVEKLNKVLQMMLDKFGDVDRVSESIGKKIEGWGRDFKSTIRYMDDTHEASKAILSLQKQMTAGFGTKVDRDTALKYLASVRKSMEDYQKYGVKTTASMKEIQKQLSIINETQKKVTENSGDHNDNLDEMNDRLATGIKRMGKLAEAAKDVHMSGLQKDLSHADRAITALFGKSAKLAKWHDIGKRGSEFKREWKEKLDVKRANHVMNYSPWKPDKFKAKESYFRLPFAEQNRIQREHYRNQVEDRVSSQGGSKFTQFINRRAAMAEVRGEEPSPMLRIGQRLATQGEGSMTKGAISGVAGGIEGGASSIMELAAPLAVVLAGMEFLKGAFDANAKKNAEVQEKLTSGGILGEKQNPIDALFNTRRNLTGPAFSRLGIGYDKNLEIAKTLNDSGIGIGNLSKDQGKDDNGFLRGSFGSLQKNVYGYGKAAGLDSNQTMAITLKLLSGYSTSLKSTEDFFVAVDKDSRAAGISVSKYIELIDAVDSSFSKMNRNLNETVTVMKLLSVNGRTTAEDLKEMVTGLTAGDKERSLAVKAFVAQKFLQNKEGVNQLGSTLNKEVSDQIDKVSEATGISKEEIQKGIAKNGSTYLTNLKNNLGGTKADGSPLDSQAAGSAIVKLRGDVENQRGFKKYSSMPGTAGALGLANLQDTLGNTFQGAAQNNMSAMEIALQSSGFKLGDLNKNSEAVYGSPAMTGISKLMGLDPRQAGEAIRGMSAIGAGNALDMAGEGDAARDSDKSEGSNYKLQTMKTIREEIERRKLQVFDPKDKRSDTEKVKGYIDSHGGRSGQGGMDVTDIYQSTDSLVRGTVGVGARDRIGTKIDDVAKASQLNKAKEIGDATITLEDRLNKVFQPLFLSLATPLQFIAKHFGMPDFATQAASAGQYKDIDSSVTSGQFSTGSGALKHAIKMDKNRLEGMTDGPEKVALQANIEQKQAMLDQATAAVTARNTGKGGLDGKGGASTDDAMAISAVSNLANFDPNKSVPSPGLIGKVKSIVGAGISSIGSMNGINGGPSGSSAPSVQTNTTVYNANVNTSPVAKQALNAAAESTDIKQGTQ